VFFQRSFVLKLASDSGRSEAVAASQSLYAGPLKPPADQPSYIGGAHVVSGQFCTGKRCGAEEGAFPVPGNACRIDVSVKTFLQHLMSRHLVLLTAFLVQPQP
jgi:hypothetical protein